MKTPNISLKRLMDTIVPITRFNRGEANRIFDEVSECGVKFVMKNNAPACVLLDPARYEFMVETLEDYALYFEATTRMESAKINGFVSSEMVMTGLGVTDADLDDVDVEIE